MNPQPNKSQNKTHKKKERLHPRNKNRVPYDLDALTLAKPELKHYIITNKLGGQSIAFSNPIAVRFLNEAILSHYYGIKSWDFPTENLCPPIPGRADYIHRIADLLGQSNFGKIPLGDKLTCLDIGVGASCIYPIIGVTEYGWQFIGSDIDQKSLNSAQQIVKSNPQLPGKIECRLQKNPTHIFQGIITKEDKVDVVLCNPPFHASLEEAQKGSRRKVKNLSGKRVEKAELNFSGISNELVYQGGEYIFIKNMVEESKLFAKNIYWFSTLVSQKSKLKSVYKLLDKIGIAQLKHIPLGTGNKASRIVAWSFLSREEQQQWRESRWQNNLTK